MLWYEDKGRLPCTPRVRKTFECALRLSRAAASSVPLSDIDVDFVRLSETNMHDDHGTPMAAPALATSFHYKCLENAKQ